MKVVLNSDYGGFDLSNKAFERLLELGFPFIQQKDSKKEDYGDSTVKIIKFTTPTPYNQLYGILQNSYEIEDLQSHPLAAQVVEELESKAWGGFAKLEVVEIPDNVDWRIVDDDGFQWIEDWDTGLRIS